MDLAPLQELVPLLKLALSLELALQMNSTKWFIFNGFGTSLLVNVEVRTAIFIFVIHVHESQTNLKCFLKMVVSFLFRFPCSPLLFLVPLLCIFSEEHQVGDSCISKACSPGIDNIKIKAFLTQPLELILGWDPNPQLDLNPWVELIPNLNRFKIK